MTFKLCPFKYKSYALKFAKGFHKWICRQFIHWKNLSVCNILTYISNSLIRKDTNNRGHFKADILNIFFHHLWYELSFSGIFTH